MDRSLSNCPGYLATNRQAAHVPRTLVCVFSRHPWLRGFRRPQEGLGRRHDVVDGEPELLLQGLQWRRSAEGVHADAPPGRTNETLPAECRSLLNCNAGRDVGWQN